ncbi:o-succinylbenzoate synthase [Candidatus Mycolicibacterium alkanivorans]|uniref:O-succinylbenzoate synthase n=1 Tax=Candidatus Mycolicibacterium alkanivorans TaxID=2954114 RepID=A0ABS9YX31_9MYCO|nr:o-succinylbenzoate synthase [Candidatus Mycolicibacterium alkanivorans]MCI4675770.1 o-succinylbenzoate synthase [Candidatus Mycolicibacterium alkanivorans]
MQTLIDFDNAPVFAIPARDGYRGFTGCEGMLLEGPQGWGEFSPPDGIADLRSARYLTAAIEAGTVGWPDPMRGRVPVAVAVPAVEPALAARIAGTGGCRTADVRVACGPESLRGDIARLEAVRDALGPGGVIRCDAGGAWDVETAVAVIAELDKAAGGLEFVEQPCASLEAVAEVRRRVSVPVAVDESIRLAADPFSLALTEAADIAVLTVTALGGVRRAMRMAETCGLSCVVAAEPDSSVGLAGGLALAGALPDLTHDCGLGTAAVLTGDLVSPGRSLIPVDGHLPVAPMPPAPDRDRLAEFAVGDPARVVRWRELLRIVQELI